MLRLVYELGPTTTTISHSTSGLLGIKFIYKTKHIVLYDGGPEGGYVYFYKERRPIWYRWERNWGE
ncbi:MAG: hypothetical protein ACKPKO_58240, partial [Candidatus Fonsibacter sp.]